LSHNTLANYYNTLFAMAQHHKYSITDVENLIPFERDLYIGMIADYLERKRLEEERHAS